MPEPTPAPAIPRARLHPAVFWTAVVALLWLGATGLDASMRRGVEDIASMLVTTLFFLGAAGLMWQRWSPRGGAQWFARAAAVVALAMLVPVMAQWLDRTDVFLRYCCRDGSMRPQPAWPLFFLWAGGLALAAFVLWGTAFRLRASLLRGSARALAWWLAAAAWTVGAALVFARNASGPVLVATMRPVGAIALVVGGLFGVFLALMALLSRKERKRRAAVDADFAAMPAAQRQEVLDVIERAAHAGPYLSIHRLVVGRSAPADVARIDGDPLARPGEAWPREDDGTPAWFLLQVPLDAPRLGPVWRRRVAVVFMADFELQVRTYEPAAEPGLVTLANPGRSVAPAGYALRRLDVPYLHVHRHDELTQEQDEDEDADPARLLAAVDGLEARLRAYSAHPEALLARVIAGRPGADWSAIDEEVQVGGDPQLIQGPHEPACPQCGARMRFLFQFGDLGDELLFGDAGMAYVYGCDAHPRECAGFVDCL